MKPWLQKLVGTVVVVQAGLAWAGEGPFTLRVGASYRDFDDVEFSALNFRNWGGQYNPAAPYGLQNVTTAPGLTAGGGDFVVLDYVRYNGSSEGIDDSDKWGPVLGFGYDLTPKACKVRLALVGNLQYYQLGFGANADGTSTAPGSFTDTQYKHYVVDGAGTILLAVPPLPGDVAMAGTTFSVRNKFDMDLYVLDLGLEARTAMKTFNFTVAVGPSLTIADAESSQSQQATWIHQGPIAVVGVPAEPNYTPARASDSKTEFLPGAYGALGVTVNISESWTIGLEYRYDYVDGDAGTRQAKIDLSGSSGMVKLAYRF